MELKEVKEYPMLNSGRIVRHMGTQSIRCYEWRKERSVWWFTIKSLPSKWRRGKSMWVMHDFEFPPPLSLSLSELEFWSAGVLFLLLILLHCREICLLQRFCLPNGSNWVFFVFLLRRSRIGWKITFIFIFWQISSTFCYVLTLCAEAPFSILK